MPILVIFIMIALAFYIFYKAKYFRSKLPVEKKWISSKSSISLGAFVALFGINQLFLFQSGVTYIVAAVFIIIGLLSIFSGINAYKFYLPLALLEVQKKKDAQ